MPKLGDRVPLVERFWSKVRKTDECWVWTASKDREGYGEIARPGKSAGMLGAHRVSWEIHFGPVPEDMDVLHTCDNPPCVRPDHLYLGTHADNMRDMALRGRARAGPQAGEDNPMSKLTWEMVGGIRERYATGAFTQKELGIEFLVSRQAIGRIVNGRGWGR